MIFTTAWVASLVAMYTVLGAAPLVFGTWVIVQRTSGLLTALWLGFLVAVLMGALAVGALGLYALTFAPLGS